uniref:Peptidase C1A papain C-terminal domain-containing protein n=2 Tax=Clastoptera arizonana TaxID=38151 RepID=A0A1B6CAL6_9HEMI
MMKLLLAFACCILASIAVQPDEDYFNDIIDKVNRQQNTWKAGKNYHLKLPRTYLQQLSGVRPDYADVPVLEMKRPENEVRTLSVPHQFDAREAWSNCPSIRRINDQSRCGSCWAVSVAEVLTDRMCVDKNLQFNISAEDLLSCCKDCGSGCNGGYPQQAFHYFVEEGITSGDFYGSNHGCKPYSIAPCSPDSTHTCSLVSTPKCVTKCRSGYPKSYKQDKYSGRIAYQVPNDVREIQKEILRNGPVQAAFTVYEDFYAYKEGVYQHVTGKKRGGHAVKIIGWGEENGVEYWLVANSWGPKWGENGFFKIMRGRNEANFETQINAGLP